MAASKKLFVRHVHTGEIREVTSEQREKQDKNYWVRVTGDDVKVSGPEPEPPVTDVSTTDPKTTSKASMPAK